MEQGILTDRQRRELEYHRTHARKHAEILEQPFSYDVLRGRRWWNAYWEMFHFLKSAHIEFNKALVVGCGFGEDAIRLAKLGADVHAFDLSPESLSIAERLAEREQVSVRFEQMPAERLVYPDGYFDVILARDILHHVDVPGTISELKRVSKPGALWVIDEIYSHSWTDRVRRSRLVENILYPLLQRFIYQGKPYITEDERKLTEGDLAMVIEPIRTVLLQRYFNAVVTRLIPDSWNVAARVDAALLRVLPIGRFVAGRALIAGRLDLEKDEVSGEKRHSGPAQ